MNNNTQSSEGVYYNVDTANICTVGGDTVQINHELIIDELPVDIDNDDMITVDAFHRFHKLPISSLPTGNPFDQDLNTFNDVQHSSLSAPNADGLVATANCQILLNRPVASSLCLNTEPATIYPKISLTDKYIPFVPSQQTSFLSFGAYNGTGINANFFASDSEYIAWERKHASNSLLFFANATGSFQTPGSLINSFAIICSMDPDRYDIFSTNLIHNSPVVTAPSSIVVNQANNIRKTASGITIDQNNNLVTDGNLTAEFLTLTSESLNSTNDSILTHGAGGLVEITDKDDLWDQSFLTTDVFLLHQFLLQIYPDHHIHH